uniref:Nudix hydrolase domain-containing protein n=1 Tax=Rhabditophanes sp. KR3021 TaxID=114890 RepID=A0AC35UIR6_9BILA
MDFEEGHTFMEQAQEAMWLYEKFTQKFDDIEKFKPRDLLSFVRRILEVLEINYYSDTWINTKCEEFNIYCQTRERAGVIIVKRGNKECLIVKNHDQYECFPKGSVKRNETTMECAIRETLEETGYDCKQTITSAIRIENSVKNMNHYLHWETYYVILNFDGEFKFSPKDKDEIISCRWISINKIPDSKKAKDELRNRIKFKIDFFFVKKLKQITQQNSRKMNS